MLTALSLSGGLVARYGSRKVTLIGGLGMCAALPLLALAPHPSLLFPGLTLFGAAMSSMDVAMNEQAVLVERKARYALMSSFHASYSVGALFGALTAPAWRPYTQCPWRSIFYWHPFLCRYPGFHVPASAAHHFRIEGKENYFPVSQTAVVGIGRDYFLRGDERNCHGGLSGVYLTRVLQTDAAFAALGYAAFSLTMTLGRMFGDWISKKIKPADMVRFGGLLTAAGLVILIITDHPALRWLNSGFFPRRSAWGFPISSRWCTARAAISPVSRPAPVSRVWQISVTWVPWLAQRP